MTTDALRACSSTLALAMLALSGCAHRAAPPIAHADPVVSRFATPLLAVEAAGRTVCALGYAQRVQCARIDVHPLIVHDVIGTEDAVELAVGAREACVASGDGTVSCFSLGEGAPGIATAIDGVADAAEVALGDGLSCARRFDGRVLCWDGDGAPAEVDALDSARAIAAVDDGACALRADGRVACWDRALHAAIVPGVSGAIDLGAGPDGTLAVIVDGSIVQFHHFGGGVFLPAAVVASVPGAVEVAVGEDGGCVRTHSGRAQCWSGSWATEEDGALEGAISIAGGDGFACAVLADGGLRCHRRVSHRVQGTIARSGL